MGRKKRVLTPAEIEERKTRWWGEERNARRRERYQTDPVYREKAIAQVRTSYRKQRLSDGLPVREDDCRENLHILSQLGQIRALRVDPERTVNQLTFTLDELARALGRNTQVVYRWVTEGMMPKPMYEARNHRNRWQAVYTEDEIRAIIGVFGRHQESSQYYRAFHAETRELLHEAVDVLRRRPPRIGAAA